MNLPALSRAVRTGLIVYLGGIPVYPPPGRPGVIGEMKNPHAVALGQMGGEIGGRSTSKAKGDAARANGLKGGRPKKHSPAKPQANPFEIEVGSEVAR